MHPVAAGSNAVEGTRIRAAEQTTAPVVKSRLDGGTPRPTSPVLQAEKPGRVAADSQGGRSHETVFIANPFISSDPVTSNV